MARLERILQFLQKECSISILSAYPAALEFDRAEILHPGYFMDSETLYICDSPEIILEYLKEGPLLSSVLLLGDHARDIPNVVTISGPMYNSALLSSINHYLRFESRIQRETNELYHQLYLGLGLDSIINTAEQYLHLPISVLDASYSMISISPLMHDLSYGMYRSEEGIFLSEQEVESLRRQQFEQQMYQTSQAFFVQPEDHPDSSWIFCAIRIQRVMTGYVALCLPRSQENTEYELRMAKNIADICSIEMQKHDFFTARAGLQYETFLTELMEGRFSDIKMIESRLRMLNHHLGSFFCLAILYSTEPHNSDLFHKRQMASLRRIFTNSMSVVYKNCIVLLINQDTPVILNEELTGPLRQFAVHNNLKVCLSQPFADILKIRIFYEQALHTLELQSLSPNEEYLFFSTNALPEFLFSKCSYPELETGIHYHIFQLQDYDKEFHTELLLTLRTFLENNRNATKTAEALNIHRSTFFYRMKKIEEILEISSTDSALLFLYELSFKIWDFLSS